MSQDTASGTEWKLELPPLPQINNDPDAHPYFQYKFGRRYQLGPEPKLGFQDDWRKKNPGLHMLYTKTAVRHLRLIDEQLTNLHNESNLNLGEMIEAIQHQRMVLVFSNAAYWDAEEILRSMGLRVGSVIEQPE